MQSSRQKRTYGRTVDKEFEGGTKSMLRSLLSNLYNTLIWIVKPARRGHAKLLGEGSLFGLYIDDCTFPRTKNIQVLQMLKWRANTISSTAFYCYS